MRHKTTPAAVGRESNPTYKYMEKGMRLWEWGLVPEGEDLSLLRVLSLSAVKSPDIKGAGQECGGCRFPIIVWKMKAPPCQPLCVKYPEAGRSILEEAGVSRSQARQHSQATGVGQLIPSHPAWTPRFIPRFPKGYPVAEIPNGAGGVDSTQGQKILWN